MIIVVFVPRGDFYRAPGDLNVHNNSYWHNSPCFAPPGPIAHKFATGNRAVFLAAAPVQSVVAEQTEQQSDPGETTPAAGAAAEPAALDATAVDPVPLETDAAAEAALQSAWDRVKESGAYAFDADVLQKQRPLASITNVGPSDQT